jgi:hypothetical protein
MGRPLVLFRFHDAFAASRERVRIIRELNPGVPVVGLFGGSRDQLDAARRFVAPLLDELFIGREAPASWKWLHSDAMVKDWFVTHGCKLSFDVLFDHEWDLLLAAPMLKLHRRATARTVALTGLERLKDVGRSWAWTSHPAHQEEFAKFSKYMDTRYGLPPKWASQGPGAVLGRAFLEAFAEAPYPPEIFDGVNSELTYPGFAEALGFSVTNTGLQPSWRTSQGREEGNRVFNSEGFPIPVRTIARELSQARGRRAFHPVRGQIMIEDLRQFAQQPGLTE